MAAEGKIFNSKYHSVVERYFKKFYKTNLNNVPFADQCVLQHSNKICVVTVAPKHPILTLGEVVKVDFQVSKNVNRLNNKVSGKGKKGGQYLQPLSQLCKVTCCNGEIYTLYSCIKGKLVEVNERLEKDPGLLSKKPMSEGYLAVVLPKLHEIDETFQELLSEKDYETLRTEGEMPEQHLIVKEDKDNEIKGTVSERDIKLINKDTIVSEKPVVGILK